MRIVRSLGVTPTEKLLSKLADRTFLKLWCYANPYKADGKELCDLIVVFENHIFLFFDRESRKFDNDETDISLTWTRWKREVVDRQIATANGATRYLSDEKNQIYLDPRCTSPFPLKLPSAARIIHNIIIAHGASDACKAFSDQNAYGSLAISYGSGPSDSAFPFMVHLEKKQPIHLFDSDNFEIVLTHLDTITDFTTYLTVKEAAISKFDMLSYCGEEDLLAHYFINYDKKKRMHIIGPKEGAEDFNGIMIGEGEWEDFVGSEIYRLRQSADEPSYLWDEIIQRTCQNALDGSLLGHPLFEGNDAIHEMAKEPRFIRRALSRRMIDAIREFQPTGQGVFRKLTGMPSYEQNKLYIFLQFKRPESMDFEGEWRPARQNMLEIACGAAKIKFPRLQKIVGIAIDSPKFSQESAEDFVLLDARNWTEEDQKRYLEANKGCKFFQTPYLTQELGTVAEFPRTDGPTRPRRIGRNDKCPCGSGSKFKRCCGSNGRRRSSTG